MSLEAVINKNTQALEALTAILSKEQVAIPTAEAEPAKKTAKKPVKKADNVVPIKSEEIESDVLTLDDLSKKTLAAVKAFGKPAVIEVLDAFDATKVPEIAAKDWWAYVVALGNLEPTIVGPAEESLV